MTDLNIDRTAAAVRTSSGFRSDERYAGADGALLILRLILAACMGLHGLVKVFGFFHGPGLDVFAKVLRGYGFTHLIPLLSWITGITEVAGGICLILGILTPLASAGLFGIGISVVIAKGDGGFFEGQGTGYEFELTLALLALVLLLTGAGRYALDARTPWGRRPLPYGLWGTALAVVAALVITLVF